MTGFGKGVAQNNRGRIKIEIKSLNYKFFEVINRLPGTLTIFEDNIRECLHKKLARGRLNLFMSYDNMGNGSNHICVDKKNARQYYNMLSSLRKALRIKGEIDINHLISLPGVITCRPQKDDPEKIWPLIEKALSSAVRDLIRSKTREGKMLKKNLEHIAGTVEVSLGKIKRRAPLVVREYRKRLLRNVKEITGTKKIFNPERVEEEAAIFARNCDISEEIHRLSSHLINFHKALSNSGEVGRRLDFIAQEMHREINTMGAKANDFPIAKEVIKMKSLVEKIREQAQNVE